MTMKTNYRELEPESLPMNRRIYGVLTSSVSSVLNGVLYLLSWLKIPAFFAAVMTIIVSFADMHTLNYYLSAQGAAATGTVFLLFLAGLSVIFFGVLLLGALLRAVFR